MEIKELKQKLEDIIFPDLEKGRSNWDMPHTKAVVYHIEQIIEHEDELKLDPYILIIAAFAHDWGYSDLFNDGVEVEYDNIARKKSLHMDIGAEKVGGLIEAAFFEFLSDEQKKDIVHLVGVHDKLGIISSVNERVLLEADTLGGLDVNFTTPTYNKDSNDKFLVEVRELRLPLFITDYSKGMFEELIKQRSNLYEK